MKQSIFIFLISFIILDLHSQEFMGIKVDGNKDSVISQFRIKGFNLKEDTQNVAIVEGFAAEQNLEVIILYKPVSKLVWKISVFLPKKNTWHLLNRNYLDYLGYLTLIYGEPDTKYEYFKKPYKEGDGNELFAVESGNCEYSAFWLTKGVKIQISDFKKINISFENLINSKIDDDEIKVVEKNEEVKDDIGDWDKTFTKVYIESEFPGGISAWARYLNRNLRYPQAAIDNEVQGTVIVQFNVDKEGNVSDVEAVSGAFELREEAVRLITNSGKWTPAVQNGRQVRSNKKQPIVFRLEMASRK